MKVYYEKYLLNSARELNEAVLSLKNGEVGVLPTETVYGFHCLASSRNAKSRISRLKKRAAGKSYLLVASDFAMVQKRFMLSKEELRIARRYWPGPLTLILRDKERNKRIGVRVTSDKLLGKIIKKTGSPLVSTSANISGEKTVKSLNEFRKKFSGRQADFFVVAAKKIKGQPSTIIRVVNGKAIVLRRGILRLND